jgi:hypothetical protein
MTDFQTLVKDVVKKDGRPVVISRYGFKVEEINEEKYLMAATEQEYNEALARLAKTKSAAGHCSMQDSGECFSEGCTGTCEPKISGGHAFCDCDGKP